MASVLKVDKLDPQSGTALEIGTSGDTITVPSGASLTLTDSTLSLPTTINTDKIDPKSGTALEIGSSGDTITIPSGATFTQSGTMNASAITAGTIATARLGSGTASSSTVLYGDQTYKAEPGGGITMADSWRMTSNQTVSTGNEDLSDDDGAAWARVNSDGYGTIGSAMTEDGTAGVFAFPATGIYYITASAIMQKNGSSRYNDLNIMTTGNDATYGIASSGRGFVIQTDSNTTISELFTDFILDVTDVANVKFKLNVLVASGDISIIGDSSTIFSGFTVIRLGDT